MNTFEKYLYIVSTIIQYCPSTLQFVMWSSATAWLVSAVLVVVNSTYESFYPRVVQIIEWLVVNTILQFFCYAVAEYNKRRSGK